MIHLYLKPFSNHLFNLSPFSGTIFLVSCSRFKLLLRPRSGLIKFNLTPCGLPSPRRRVAACLHGPCGYTGSGPDRRSPLTHCCGHCQYETHIIGASRCPLLASSMFQESTRDVHCPEPATLAPNLVSIKANCVCVFDN